MKLPNKTLEKAELMKLSNKTLEKAEKVSVPEYDRSSLTAGIIHIGLGNFHRAHQAWYLDRLFAMGASHDWAIIGAGVRSADAAQREKLIAQDCLSTIIELEPRNNHARIIGSMIDFLPVEKGNSALIKAMSQESIRIVSLTITEGGYYINSALGKFDASHPDIRHDSQNWLAPHSAFGAIIAALRARRAAGIPAFTVMSCDNLPQNGQVARDAVIGLARLQDPNFSEWISANVAFPNSMVDCITPATGQREIALARSFGIDDSAPVVCEPFRQWVIENNFPMGRPKLELLDELGIVFTPEVTKFELMKLRILNGGHAAIAYPAALLEIPFVHEAMKNPFIRGFLDKLELEEIIPSVPEVPNMDLHEYYKLVTSRFENPEIDDTVSRLCLDGSNRQPKFILPVTRQALSEGKSIRGLALVSALWCRYCAATSDKGTAIAIDDTSAVTLTAHALRSRVEPLAFLELSSIFGDVAQNDIFRDAFKSWLTKLWLDGVEATLQTYIQQ